jgi:hypothetical protein
LLSEEILTPYIGSKWCSEVFGFLRTLTTLMIAAVAMVVEAITMYGMSMGDE